MALLAGSAATAGAHYSNTKHKLSMRILPVTPATATYDGKLEIVGESDLPACERNRKIKVFHNGVLIIAALFIDLAFYIIPDQLNALLLLLGLAYNGVLIAKTRTNSKGKWKATGARPPIGDKVVAKAPFEALTQNREHDHVCGGAKATEIAP